jgi:hypothetical protein
MQAANPDHRSPTADVLRETARSLRLDLAAAEAIEALEAAGLHAILMKGPLHQRALYPDGAPRPYLDVDLLVAPDSMPRVRAVLRGLGFEHMYTGETANPEHADTWVREGDGAVLDIHWTLVGASAGPAEVWRTLGACTERVPLGKAEVEALVPPAVALQVAMHAAQHGPANRRSMDDLRRALTLLDEDVWVRAAELAGSLDAEEMFAAGLRLDPAGRELAIELGLTSETSVETALLVSSPPPLALGVERLARTQGLGRKLALLAREAVPSPDFMRYWWPPSRRGPLWLALAYPRRLVWLALRAAPALLAWRRSVRDSRGPGARLG